MTGKRVLDPISRVSEILFGLIMVLTFTCSISAGEAGREEIRTMLIGAISCNVAWGLVDAVMYLMTSLTERGRELVAWRALRGSPNREEANRMVADLLPPLIVNILRPDDFDSLRERIKHLPEVPEDAQLKKKDWLGALAVFLLVFLSTFPVVVPFLFMDDPIQALRISNGIAIAMLFFTGYVIGKYAGHRPWRTGLSLVAVGILLVAVTMALGG